MTTPEERRRNVIWGRETLEELNEDSAVPTAWRAEASCLLSRYPSLERLQVSDDVDLDRLQAEFLPVLMAAKLLFQRVQHHASITAQRRYTLKVVLRHFV